jgi:hypothetical protein
MNMNIIVPDFGDDLSSRLDKLRDKNINLHVYDGEIIEDPILMNVKVVKRLQEDFYSNVIYCASGKPSYCFDTGGVEKIIGIIPFGKEGDLYDELIKCTQNLEIPIYSNPPSDFEKDNTLFVEMFSEVHLIDGRDSDICALDNRLFYFILPGKKYIEQPYIQRLMLDDNDRN